MNKGAIAAIVAVILAAAGAVWQIDFKGAICGGDVAAQAQVK